MRAAKRRTKSRRLKEHLLTEMVEQRIGVGQQLPTEAELMRQFSLSRGTVQRVLADLSAEGWVERQQGRGTFRLGPAPRHPASERTMLVGIWFNMPCGPMYGPVTDGIRKELARWGYHGVFEAGGLEFGAESRGILDLVHKRLDGFIVAPSTTPRDDHRPLIELIERGLPVVLVDGAIAGYDTDLVTTDNELGAEEVVRHLVELGHRRIGFVGIAGLPTIEERYRGYRLMMRTFGLDIEESWVQNTEQTAADCGRQAIRSILALPPEVRPTAIFGANDCIAQTCAIVARDQGLKIPYDLSVAGFDGLNREPDHPFRLTTYAQPTQRMGRHAARLLMRRIHAPSECTLRVVLEGELVTGESTSSPPAPGCSAACVSDPAGEATTLAELAPQ